MASQQKTQINTSMASDRVVSAREEWEERLARSEAQLESLRLEIQSLREDWENKQEHSQGALQQDYEILREAVLRYAVACGAVDVQVAMLRARGTGDEAADSLRRAMEEQTDASNVLRALARTLQQEPKL
jgi:hypothetical protein